VRDSLIIGVNRVESFFVLSNWLCTHMLYERKSSERLCSPFTYKLCIQPCACWLSNVIYQPVGSTYLAL